MHIRKLIWVFALIGLLAVAAMAADVTGKWKAESPGRDGTPMVTTFNFKVDGEKLTGTVSGRQADIAISDGKVSGDDISFVVVRTMGGEERKIQYKGKVSGDEIKMTVQFSPEMPPREMVAKKVKE